MKLTTNFAGGLPRLVRRLRVALGLACAAALALLAVVAADVASRQADIALLRERLAAYEQRPAPAAPALPAVEELAATKQRVAQIRELGRVGASSPAVLLAELEARMTAAVRLASLHHLPREGGLELVAESASAQALTQFLLALEQSPRFRDVMLVRQTQRDGAAGRTIQFEIRLRERA